MSRKHGAVRMFQWIIFVFFLFLMSSRCMAARDPGAVKLARKHTLTSGGFAADEKGTCYLDENGELVTNTWAMADGKVYCFDKEGYCRTGVFKYRGATYYAEEDGQVAVERMVRIGEKTCYFGKTAAMKKKCWVVISGKKYYFNASGAMLTNCWTGNFYVGPDGARVSGIIRKNILAKCTKKEIKSGKKLIIIGASRVHMMRQAVMEDKGVIYITGIGKGLKWFRDKGLLKLQAYLVLFPNSTVVLQLGNNDLKTNAKGNFSSYASIYRKLIRRYTGARFFLMDILPGDSVRMNKLRMAFNKRLAAAFPKYYIGGYDFLVEGGYETTDGTHYTKETSIKIFDYIKEAVQ